MKQKSGKISSGAIVLIVLALVGLWYFNVAGIQDIFSQPSEANQPVVVNTVNPYITVTALDRQSTGTSVAVSAKGSFNGGGFSTITLGSTTAVPGQTLELLLTNNTQYHNAKVSGISVTATSFPLTVQMDKNATVTENMYSTTGVVMTNDVGNWATNQTILGLGATYNWKDEMQANGLTSTNDMLCIIEIVNGVNASTSPLGAVLTGTGVTFVSTSKPSWYSTNGTGSNVYLYNVPALDSSATKTFNLQINSKSTGDFDPSANFAVRKTCYTKEYFIDPNTGKIVYDVADSAGTLKSMAQYVYTVGMS